MLTVVIMRKIRMYSKYRRKEFLKMDTKLNQKGKELIEKMAETRVELAEMSADIEVEKENM